MIRRALLLFLLVYFCFWFPFTYKRISHPFRLDKCYVEWPFNPEWEIEPLPAQKMEEISEVLSQPFSYLAKGRQSFVFLSRDQKYVLKLFSFDLCKIPLGQAISRKVKKWAFGKTKQFFPTRLQIDKNFTSCKLAYTLAPNQTGLVFIHLNPKENGLPLITVKDRMGKSYRVDPAKYRFVLQKKAVSYREVLKTADLKVFADSYRKLFDEIETAGLVNLDLKLGTNFGFLDGRPIVIDVGNFIYSPERAVSQAEGFRRYLDLWKENPR